MKKLLVTLTLASSLFAGAAIAGSGPSLDLSKAVAYDFASQSDANLLAKKLALSPSDVGPSPDKGEFRLVLKKNNSNQPSVADLLQYRVLEVVFNNDTDALLVANRILGSAHGKALLVHDAGGQAEVVVFTPERMALEHAAQ